MPLPGDRRQAAGHSLADHELGLDYAHVHDGEADHDHDYFRRRRAARREPALDPGPRDARQRRHRHRLVGHPGHLLQDQPAPARRGSVEPLLRRLARDPVPVGRPPDALPERGAHRRRRASAPSSTTPMRPRTCTPTTSTPASSSSPAKRCAARTRKASPASSPRGAASSSAPPPAITWKPCWPPTARAPRACRMTRASASSTSISAAAPPSWRWSRAAGCSPPRPCISAGGCRS